jgi:hypothetical protein
VSKRGADPSFFFSPSPHHPKGKGTKGIGLPINRPFIQKKKIIIRKPFIVK